MYGYDASSADPHEGYHAVISALAAAGQSNSPRLTIGWPILSRLESHAIRVLRTTAERHMTPNTLDRAYMI